VAKAIMRIVPVMRCLSFIVFGCVVCLSLEFENRGGFRGWMRGAEELVRKVENFFQEGD